MALADTAPVAGRSTQHPTRRACKILVFTAGFCHPGDNDPSSPLLNGQPVVHTPFNMLPALCSCLFSPLFSLSSFSPGLALSWTCSLNLSLGMCVSLSFCLLSPLLRFLSVVWDGGCACAHCIPAYLCGRVTLEVLELTVDPLKSHGSRLRQLTGSENCRRHT